MKCIAAAFSLSFTLLGASPAQAQIKPDNTLGVDGSIVNNNTIQGGAQRGTNLFHSFTDFSIGDGQRVDFVNPIGVNNIITRVTDTPSNINGTLGILGNANLFFLNPNGILFGQNSRLDMAGTFVGSTANGLKFADGNVYGTVNPQVPLLTMTTPVGLQFGSRIGDINFTGTTGLLANYDSNSLVFAGGNITLTGSRLILPNGKVELAAVNDVGSIAIDTTKLTDTRATSLAIPDGLRRGDITVQNGARISTAGTNSGNIDLQARQITVAGAESSPSVISARSTGNVANTQGGSIKFNATGDVSIAGNNTGISSSTLGDINGGDITITARNLQILNGAYLEASPYGMGNGGNISIAAIDTVKIGAPINAQESDILTSAYGSGNSGNIDVKTAKFSIQDGAKISTGNSDGGASGSLTIAGLNGRSADSIEVSNSEIATSGTISGNINLQTRDLTVVGMGANRAQINARSTGNVANTQGGSIKIDATGDVLISGNNTGISSSNTQGAIDGGDIQINARNLQILDGAYLETSPYKRSSGRGGNISIAVTDTVRLGAPTNGQESDILTSTYGLGTSGNITIQTGKLIHKDGAQIGTDYNYIDPSNPLSIGKLGDIKIVAKESIEVSGVSPAVFLYGFPKATAIATFSAGRTDSGNIDIQTPKFVLKDGAVISAGTDGSGLGGSISIAGLNGRPADSVELLGNSNLGQFLGTENVPGFAGVGNGSRIRSITSDTGNAGVVKINADRVTLQGGTRIDVSTLASGQGGSIDIQANTVNLVDGGQLISTTKGSGQAGTINVRADKILTLGGIDPTFEAKRAFLSLILVVSNQPAARAALGEYLQNPNPTAQQSVLAAWQQTNPNPVDRQVLDKYFTFLQTSPTARSSLQSYLTKTDGTGSFSDYNLVLNVGNTSGIISRSQSGSTGNGGNINLTSPNLNIQQGALVTVNSNGDGRGGNITANADAIKLDRGAITAKTVSANGGDIDLNVNKLLLLRNQSEISASAATNGNGGNINIFAPNGLILAVPNENSNITASAAGGQGGKIQIRADNVLGFSTQRTDLSNITATSTFGPQGIVTITTLGNDPNKGLQPDPIAPNPPTISQTCARSSDKQASTFIDSGKGGMTPSAIEP
ncbi:filamentous hemagglutinin N-terminal domain-containing protein, partial [Chamaesiphon sp. OTE_20_metabat_361]|uniref:two-partner secretion domain-containing protein n=1 Tax=Chamaesiphon sp. OTE_20_metabat_361 TaxID=2964689 RepID=UPI00286C2F10